MKLQAAEDLMQTIQNCEDKAVMDETASESWQKLLSTATYESILT